MSFETCVSLGAFRNLAVGEALAQARRASEPVWGRLSVREVQICPQNAGALTTDVAEWLRLSNPDVRFRLHANARAAGWSSIADASTFGMFEGYFSCLRAVSRALDAPAYTPSESR